MIIAQCGKFVLCTKTYADEHEYYVRDIELGKFKTADEYINIANFNKDGALVSVGSRLLGSLESQEDADNARRLAEIAAAIYEGENVKSGYVPAKA